MLSVAEARYMLRHRVFVSRCTHTESLISRTHLRHVKRPPKKEAKTQTSAIDVEP